MSKPTRDTKINHFYLDSKPVREVCWDKERQGPSAVHCLAKGILHGVTLIGKRRQNYANALAALVGFPDHQAWPKDDGVFGDFVLTKRG